MKVTKLNSKTAIEVEIGHLSILFSYGKPVAF